MLIETVVADDEPDIRMLLRLVLASEADVEVTGEAASGAEAIDRCTALRPRVLVLDQRMPGMDGLEVARRLRASGCGLGIVLYSAHMSDELRDAAAAAGVDACLPKGEVQALGALIRSVVAA